MRKDKLISPGFRCWDCKHLYDWDYVTEDSLYFTCELDYPEDPNEGDCLLMEDE